MLKPQKIASSISEDPGSSMTGPPTFPRVQRSPWPAWAAEIRPCGERDFQVSSRRQYFEEILKGQEAGGEDLRAVGQIPEQTKTRCSVSWSGRGVERNQKAQLLPAHRFFLQECVSLRAPTRNAMCCYNSPAVVLPLSEP